MSSALLLDYTRDGKVTRSDIMFLFVIICVTIGVMMISSVYTPRPFLHNWLQQPLVRLALIFCVVSSVYLPSNLFNFVKLVIPTLIMQFVLNMLFTTDS